MTTKLTTPLTIGSLIWRPPPHTVERVPGYIKGYVRRFWQQSTDHRGTIAAPGRVVTLLTREEWQRLESSEVDDYCWGVAYRIDPTYAEEVKANLDYREKNGYSIHKVEVHSNNGVINALAYIGSIENPEWVGPAPLDEMARQIHESVGPSGPNKEYLYNLAQALRDLAPAARDEHLFGLEKRVKELDGIRLVNGQ